MERWREHYSTTLNHAAATQCADLDTQANCALPSWNISSDPPTMEEIAKSIRKLNGRAAGPDDIHPELLMYAVGPISSIMHALFLKALFWHDCLSIQGKGPQNQCSSPPFLLYSYSAICTMAPLHGFELTAVSQHSSSQHLGFMAKGCMLAPALFCQAIDWILEMCL